MSTINAGTTLTTALSLTGDTSGTLSLATGGTARMLIDGSGNVGIGIATPLQRFNAVNTSITGGAPATSGSAADPNAVARFQAGSVAMDVGVYAAGQMWIQPRSFTNYATNYDLVLQPNGGNVGIGTSSPVAGYRLNVVNDSGNAQQLIRAGTNFNSTISFGDQDSSTSGQVLYAHNGDYMRFDTNGSERMRITAGGEVYIAGTTDQGAYNLQCNGTGVWGAGAYVNGSDARLKDDITTLNDGLNVVSQLRPVTFKYKPDYSKDQNVQTGFIAQELQTALEGKDYLDGIVQAGPNHLNVAYQSLIPILTKAIQEQQAMIDELKAKVAALETK